MKIGAISSMGYIKNNKNNNAASSIVSRNLVSSSNQLKNYSKIPFRGKQEVADFLESVNISNKTIRHFSSETPVEYIQRVFASKPDELEFFLLDERNYPILYLANGEQIETFTKILGDKSPKVIANALRVKTKARETALYLADAKKIESITKALGDNAPQVIEKTLLEQDIFGKTALHSAKPEGIRAYKEVFKEDTDRVFGRVLPIRDRNNELAINPGWTCDLAKLEALIEVAPNATAKALLMNCKNGTYLDLWLDKIKKC